MILFQHINKSQIIKLTKIKMERNVLIELVWVSNFFLSDFSLRTDKFETNRAFANLLNIIPLLKILMMMLKMATI